MQFSWKDVVTSTLAVFGGIVVFAKLQDYSWWLIGSWKGALGVIAVTGLAILAVNLIELLRVEEFTTIGEMALWLTSATVIVASLLVTTTKAEFIASAILVGLSWVAQLTSHIWGSLHTDDHRPHYVHS